MDSRGVFRRKVVNKSMKKRIISLFLAVLIVCSMIPNAFAASNEALDAANTLRALGLFKGVGTDASGAPVFELDRAPTRHEAVTMLVRLLGKEDEALAGNWETPFTDVDDWAKPYVGYAYANGLTNGTGKDTFGGKDPVSATQYLTFVLRALGYQSGSDFKWDAAWELTDKLGITNGSYGASSAFTRGDVAIVSLAAINTPIRYEGRTILDRMNGVAAEKNVVYEDRFVKITYEGFEPYANETKRAVVIFNVENKGAAFYDGKVYPYIQVRSNAVAFNGETRSFNEMGASYCVVAAGSSQKFYAWFYSPIADLSKSLNSYGVHFTLNHGESTIGEFSAKSVDDEYYSKLDTFTSHGTTTAYTGLRNPNGGTVNQTPLQLEKCAGYVSADWEKIYSDDNIEMTLYRPGPNTFVSLFLTNKTNALVNVKPTKEILDGKEQHLAILWSADDTQWVLPHSSTITEMIGIDSDLFEKGYNKVQIDATVTVGVNSYTISAENSYVLPEPEPEIKSEDYAYLAGTDFRSIRRTYSTAVAQHGYVYAYKNVDGDLCVLTMVQYKIGTKSFIDYKLHNMTTGKTSTDPVGYYKKLATKSYGATKIKYLEMASTVSGYMSKMNSAVANIIQTGENNWKGVYVSANVLNL